MPVSTRKEKENLELTIARERQDGLITMKEFREQMGIRGKVPMTEGGTKFLMAFIFNKDNENFKKNVQQMMGQDHLPYKIAYKNAEAHGVLGNCVDPLSLATMIAFDINSPGKANLFLIDLLNFYFEKGRPASIDDISMDLYPFGFYTAEDAMNIIDNALKINNVYFSSLY